MRALLLALVCLLAPGCFTMGLWEAAYGANEPTSPGPLHRANLQGNVCSLIASYTDHGPTLIRFDLSRVTNGFFSDQAAHVGEIVGPHRSDLPDRIELVESPDLGASSGDEVATGADPSGSAPPAPQAPTLYWRGEHSGQLEACLRRPGQEPVYLIVPALDASFASTLTYVGAGLLTPFTVTLDVVTFPVQAGIAILFIGLLEEIFS